MARESALASAIPEDQQKILTNIRKTQRRAQKQKQAEREARRKQRDDFEHALEGSESEDSDIDTDRLYADAADDDATEPSNLLDPRGAARMMGTL